eukprot:m51a1_g14344 hypothetical protein (221) ;mRNA; f:167107-168071
MLRMSEQQERKALDAVNERVGQLREHLGQQSIAALDEYDVVDVLCEMHLGVHARAFVKNEISGRHLVRISRDRARLRELGMGSLADCLRLRHALTMVEACGQLCLLEAQEVLRHVEVTGDMLLHLCDEDLKELGVKVMGQRDELLELVEKLHDEYYAALADYFVAPDGSVYEAAAIRRWLEKHNTSPLTGLPIAKEPLVHCRTLRNDIQEFRKRSTRGNH